MDCPNCVGKMELAELDGRQVYHCPICDHQESETLVLDKARWWGSVHLPVIDIFIRPTAAFRQLSENPAVLANLLFSLGSSFVNWHVSLTANGGAMRRKLLTFPLFELPVSGVLATFLMSLFLSTMFAAVIHVSAKLICEFNSKASRVAFVEIWSIVAFLHSVFMLLYIPYLVNHSLLFIYVGTFIYEIVLSLLAIRTIYGFSVARSVGVWFSAVVASGIAITLIAATAFVAILVGHAGSSRASHAASMQRINRPADYQWSIKTLDGKPVPFSTFKDKAVFLNFWATWCGPCRMEMPSIQKLYDAFKDNPKIAFLCVSTENADVVKTFLAKNSYTFPVYVTEGFEPPPTYSHDAIPTTYIISRTGRIVIDHSGATDWFTDANRALMQSLSVSTATPSAEPTKAIDIPAATVDDREITVQPMANLNGKTRAEILARRTSEVFRYPELAPAHYQPDPEIFKLEDGRPWWGTAGLYFYGRGPKSAEGLSEQSRYLFNPFLLIGLREAFAFKSAEAPPAKDDYAVQPRAVRWRPSEKTVTAYYDLTKAIGFAETVHPPKLARIFSLETYNARDFGYRYFAIDGVKSTAITATQEAMKPQPNPSYLAIGGMCGVVGGCNNVNPQQKDLNFRVNNLPARLEIKLWKEKPWSRFATPDMTVVLVME